MYICLCNPFSDHDVRNFLSGQPGKASVGQVYRSCSGGEAPCCGSCVPTLKDMVREHNSRAEVRAIGESLVTAPEKEQA